MNVFDMMGIIVKSFKIVCLDVNEGSIWGIFSFLVVIFVIVIFEDSIMKMIVSVIDMVDENFSELICFKFDKGVRI